MAVDTATVIGLSALSYLALQKADFLNKGTYGEWGKFIGFNVSIFLDFTLLTFLSELATGLDASMFPALTNVYLFVFFIPNMLLTFMYLMIGPLESALGINLNSVRQGFGQKPREA